jgi:hypothetical protein
MMMVGCSCTYHSQLLKPCCRDSVPRRDGSGELSLFPSVLLSAHPGAFLFRLDKIERQVALYGPLEAIGLKLAHPPMLRVFVDRILQKTADGGGIAEQNATYAICFRYWPTGFDAGVQRDSTTECGCFSLRKSMQHFAMLP